MIKIKIDVHSEAKTNRREHIFGPNTVMLETTGCINRLLISTIQMSVYIPAGIINMKP